MTYPFKLKIVADTYCIYDCPSDWTVNETGTTFHRIYYPYTGYAVYEDSHQKLELKPGSLYIFPTNKPYKISHDPNRPFKCLWFHIEISPILLNSVIKYDLEKQPAAYHTIKAIEYLVDNRKSMAKENLIIEEQLHSLFFLVSLNEKFITLNDSYLRKVTDYVHINFMEEITNEVLSSISGYDPSYLIRLFKKTFGVTPQKYILNYRLSKAISLIREKTPISEVSKQVGYMDSKAFCRIFKKVKGVPPSEYKKSQFWQP